MRTSSSTEPAARALPDAGEVRRRVRLLVEITARVGDYRAGLRGAARRLTSPEAAIVADLEGHGLDVGQLSEVLRGAHVLVDDPGLYSRWRYPRSRERLSSHHKTIDKDRYPDLGLTGPLVREKLHGRTVAGTWMQLEKTPAAMGDGFRLPTFHDLLHLWDFIVYRITRSNVGPWGLSRQTERRPMYLSPSLAVKVPVPPAAEAELTGALERIEDDDALMSASPDLARCFPPPDRADTLAELVFVPGSREGRGLFGAAGVHVRGLQSAQVRALVDEARAGPPGWTLPGAGSTRSTTVRGGRREVRCAVRRVPGADQEEHA